MINRIKRIIFLLALPLSQRDWDRFGIDILKSSGFDVETWDMSAWLFPEYTKPASLPYFNSNRTFISKNAALHELSSLGPECCVITVCNLSYRSLPIFRAISASNARYSLVNLQALPSASSGINRLHALFGMSWSHIGCKIMSRIFVSRVPLRPPDFLIAAAEGTQCMRPYCRDFTKIIWSHSLDYDYYLENKFKLPHEETGVAVFLDEYFPFHPDLHLHGYKRKLSIANYYSTLRHFFDCFEKRWNYRVIIAVHPSADMGYEKNGYFGEREITRGTTMQAVSRASMVFTHASTAIDFAVILRKPIMFLVMDMMHGLPVLSLAQSMASLLQRPLLNLDHLNRCVSKQLPLHIDVKAYELYQRLYIKIPGTPELKLWQIVANELNNTSACVGTAAAFGSRAHAFIEND